MNRMGKHNYKIDRNKLSIPLDVFDASISDLSIIRLSRKLFAEEEVIDLRLWRYDKFSDSFFPRKGQGLCMRTKFWKLALKLFVDNNLAGLGLQPSELPATPGPVSSSSTNGEVAK